MTLTDVLDAFNERFPKINISTKRLAPILRHTGYRGCRGTIRDKGRVKRITVYVLSVDTKFNKMSDKDIINEYIGKGLKEEF